MSGYFYTTAGVVGLGMITFIVYEFRKDKQKKQHPARAGGAGRAHPARQRADHPALRQHPGGHDHGAAAAASDPGHPETAHRTDRRAGNKGHKANGSAVLVQQAAASQADTAAPVAGPGALIPAPVQETPASNPQLAATQTIMARHGGRHHRR